MANRKSGKEFRKDYNDLLLKKSVLENRIIDRAIGLCQYHPDVILGKITDAKYFRIYHFEQPQSLITENYLKVIEIIEKHLASQHPYKQGDLFEKPEIKDSK